LSRSPESLSEPPLKLFSDNCRNGTPSLLPDATLVVEGGVRLSENLAVAHANAPVAATCKITGCVSECATPEIIGPSRSAAGAGRDALPRDPRQHVQWSGPVYPPRMVAALGRVRRRTSGTRLCVTERDRSRNDFPKGQRRKKTIACADRPRNLTNQT
jgi:hypothetical protein